MAQENKYFIEAENAAEMARLLKLDRFLTEAMGGPLPELAQEELANLHDVLDIACGPGGWALDVANAYRSLNVTGVDISDIMIRYANNLAETTSRANAHFRHMNALSLPFPLPDQSFDLINARLLVGFMPTTFWPHFLKECQRVLRPGGLIRLTECEGGIVGITTSVGCEILNRAGTLALHRVGQSFTPNDAVLGSTAVLPSLLRRAGYQNVQNVAHAIDWSANTRWHDASCQNALIGFRLLKPFLLRHQAITEQAFQQAYQRMEQELQAEDFCGMWYFVTVSGTNPLQQKDHITLPK
jgi:ubiquinone/menaquinone biosynthesis C-methylase UbiE